MNSLASLDLRAPLRFQVVPVAQDGRDLLLVDKPLLDRSAANLARVLVAHDIVVQLLRLLPVVLKSPRVHGSETDAPDWIRTSDLRLRRTLLSLLSYGSIQWCGPIVALMIPCGHCRNGFMDWNYVTSILE